MHVQAGTPIQAARLTSSSHPTYPDIFGLPACKEAHWSEIDLASGVTVHEDFRASRFLQMWSSAGNTQARWQEAILT